MTTVTQDLLASLREIVAEEHHGNGCEYTSHFFGIQFIRGRKKQEAEREARRLTAPPCNCWLSRAQAAIARAEKEQSP